MESSSDTASELSLLCSFSTFESKISEQEEQEAASDTIEPYQFEPLASKTSEPWETQKKTKMTRISFTIETGKLYISLSRPTDFSKGADI